MLRYLLLLPVLVTLPSACCGQLLSDVPFEAGDRYAEPVVGRFQVGAEITATRGATRNILAMVAVPLECDEQSVRVVNEEFTPDVAKIAYRDLAGDGARQMVVSVPYLAAGTTARAVVTFEVATRPRLAPEDDVAAELRLPRKLPSNVRRFRSPSPYIESRHGTIRSLSADILKEAPDDAGDWAKIELLYDYVLDNIEYLEGPDTSALTTLRDGSADCHGRSALFIALCRAADYPARVVWVNNHCYAEFYLEDAEGVGSWWPIESAGSRAFGEMPLARVILQKGDSFTVPERKREKLRYATDFMVGLPVGNAGKPKVRYIREQL